MNPTTIPDNARLIEGDTLENLRQLESASVGTIVTSPPYYLRTLDRRRNPDTPDGAYPSRGARGWSRRHNMDNAFGHDMSLDAYLAYHREVVAEMRRVLRHDGSLWYNHRERVQAGKLEELAVDILGDWLRQRVIWAKGGSPAHNHRFLLPAHEYVYLCAGDAWTRPTVRADGVGGETVSTVWHIRPERDNPHPAPFPIALAARCIIAGGERGPVLDPFIGSGTTAIAAMRLGLPWIGIERSAEYLAMAGRRVAAEMRRPTLVATGQRPAGSPPPNGTVEFDWPDS